MFNLSEYAERLKELMIEYNINQTQLAERINVKVSTISRYLSEQNVPEIEILIRLADCFNCSINFLVGRSENTSAPNSIYQKCPPFTVQFKKLLSHFKVSKYKLQREAKISKTIMYYWETGKYQPSIENIIKLANYFDCSVDYILGRVDYN